MKGSEVSLIIEASALACILEDKIDKETKFWFLKIVRQMKTVICARVSPNQKAQVVKMMMKDDPSLVTLSVGDGANDVAMIL